MKIAWLAPYNIASLVPDLELNRSAGAGHACSWIVSLSNALANRDGLELHLVTESPRVSHDQSFTRSGIHFHVLKSSLPFVNRGLPGWLPLNALSGFFLEKRRLIKTIRRISPDIVHGHGTEAAFGAAATKCELPAIISIQGIITEYFEHEPNLYYRLVKRLEIDQVRRAHYFTCRTHWDTGFVHRFNPHARIFNIEEAMNPVFFENEWKAADDPSLLFVGSLAERKGLHFLIEALSLVKESFPNVRLTVAGESHGPRRGVIDDQCRRLLIADNIHFVGFKNANKIARLQRENQVFVLASKLENSPNTVAEAMVSGMPVIATNVGGVSSMVQDHTTGLLVRYGDVEHLADRILLLLKNIGERKRLGAAARKVAWERHHPDKVAEKTVSAYREILRETS